MTAPTWIKRDEGVDLGYLPTFLDNGNPRDAVKQLHVAYLHGGGWQEFEGFTLEQFGPPSADYPWYPRYGLRYPGDPLMEELARTHLHDEECIVLFRHDWVAVIQKDGAYRVTRID